MNPKSVSSQLDSAMTRLKNSVATLRTLADQIAGGSLVELTDAELVLRRTVADSVAVHGTVETARQMLLLPLMSGDGISEPEFESRILELSSALLALSERNYRVELEQLRESLVRGRITATKAYRASKLESCRQLAADQVAQHLDLASPTQSMGAPESLSADWVSWFLNLTEEADEIIARAQLSIPHLVDFLLMIRIEEWEAGSVGLVDAGQVDPTHSFESSVEVAATNIAIAYPAADTKACGGDMPNSVVECAQDGSRLADDGISQSDETRADGVTAIESVEQMLSDQTEDDPEQPEASHNQVGEREISSEFHREEVVALDGAEIDALIPSENGASAVAISTLQDFKMHFWLGPEGVTLTHPLILRSSPESLETQRVC